MLASFYRPAGRRTRILMEAGAFSSDRHAVASQIAWRGLDPEAALLELAPPADEDTVPEEAIEACLARHGEEIALVLWPGVQFRTGQAFDLARIGRAAHRHGCIAGFDLAHSIGNTPLALHDAGADFAVWCSYKYLNGGPGAIGGCFVHQRHLDAQPRLRHSGGLPGARLAGWWGHEQTTRFLMEPQFRAAGGVAAWQISNPPILAAAPLIASLAIFTEARMERLRAAGYTQAFTPLEEGVRDYVQRYLSQPDPYR
jgi:kynureninase